MAPTPPFLLPPNEVERLQALRQLDFQRSLRETVFDAFVRLTAHIFDLPISLISLVEEDQVEYIANAGLPGLCQQPRIEAICSLAVREGQAVIFTDIALQTTRLSEQAAAAARQKNLCFYAGVPLRLPNARCIGTLCIIGQQDRSFSAHEQVLLEAISDLVVHTLAVRHLCQTNKKPDAANWAIVHDKLLEELQGLMALMRYLFTRFGRTLPVPEIILTHIQRRFQDIRLILVDYQQVAP